MRADAQRDAHQREADSGKGKRNLPVQLYLKRRAIQLEAIARVQCASNDFGNEMSWRFFVSDARAADRFAVTRHLLFGVRCGRIDGGVMDESDGAVLVQIDNLTVANHFAAQLVEREIA